MATQTFDLRSAGRTSIEQDFQVELLNIGVYQPMMKNDAGNLVPKTGLDPMSRITVRYPHNPEPVTHLVFNRVFPNGKLPFIGSQPLPIILTAYQSTDPKKKDADGNPRLQISGVRFDVENLHEKAIALLKD